MKANSAEQKRAAKAERKAIERERRRQWFASHVVVDGEDQETNDKVRAALERLTTK